MVLKYEGFPCRFIVCICPEIAVRICYPAMVRSRFDLNSGTIDDTSRSGFNTIIGFNGKYFAGTGACVERVSISFHSSPTRANGTSKRRSLSRKKVNVRDANGEGCISWVYIQNQGVVVTCKRKRFN